MLRLRYSAFLKEHIKALAFFDSLGNNVFTEQLLGILATLITAFLIPWLKAKAKEAQSHMNENQLCFYKLIAGVVADAAQQLYCDNEKKLEYAMQ